MSKDIRLFISCHHRNVSIPDNPLLFPMQVGSAIAKDRFEGMLHDDEGDNISAKNKSYCELTGQYWAWRNIDADYYGFMHYRRYFNFSHNLFPEHHEPFIFGDVVFPKNDPQSLHQISFDEPTMRKLIEECDFIAPTPVAAPNGATVYEQYRESVGHHIEDLDTVMFIIQNRYPEIWPSAKRYLSQTKSYVCNMFIMKRELFFSYSNFLFDVLQTFEELTDTSHYTSIGRRVAGYLGERICGIYLTYLKDSELHGCELQRVYFKEQDCSVEFIPVSSDDGREIKLGTITRGSGKIYCQLLANWDSEEGCLINSESITLEGNELPSKVLQLDGKQLVLITPVVNTPQKVTLNAFSNKGNLLFGATLTINQSMAKLQSRANTLFSRAEVNTLRNCDRQFLDNDTVVHILEVLPETNPFSGITESYLIRGTVTYVRDSVDPKEAIELRALNIDGSNALVSEWFCLGDDTTQLEPYPGYETRVISFSVRVLCAEHYILWAHFPDRERQDGFFSLESFATKNYLDSWNARTCPACNDPSYHTWFIESHKTSPAELALQRKRTFKIPPLFSIIVPLFKTPLAYFNEMIDSVRSQTYSNWQLILVNASPDDKALSEAIMNWCVSDSRIIAVTLDENLGITENTNKGMAVATGNYLCFLDHDDTLEPDALFWYASHCENDATIDMIYCDEDKLLNGKYVQPYFKPEWDPELILGMNYVCHFLAVKKSLIDAMPKPGREFDGSQDYNMTLFASEHARTICHVPRILYHWRIHPNSTAQNPKQKDYALETSRKAVEAHFQRCGILATVEDSPLSPRRFVIDYPIKDKPLVSIIIPNKDSIPVLHRCISSIAKQTTYPNYEVIIIENNSTKPSTFEYYSTLSKAFSNIRIVEAEPSKEFNYSRLINIGVHHAKGSYVLQLNNDIQVVTKNWIEILLGQLLQNGVGATGAKLFFPDDTIQHAGIVFCQEGPGHLAHRFPKYSTGNMESLLLRRDVSAVTGACLMVEKSLYEQIGGMDENLRVNYNDIDLCLKIQRKGYRIVICPEAKLYHYESVSRGYDLSGSSMYRARNEKGKFMEKWPKVFEMPDPHESPNFEKYSIAQTLSSKAKRTSGFEN